MFTKINQVMFYGILIVTPCVLAGNDGKESVQDLSNAAIRKLNRMDYERWRLENSSPMGNRHYGIDPVQDPGNAAIQKKINRMANERLRLEMIDPTEKMYIGDNPLDKFTSAINFVDSTNNDHGPPGSRFPAYIIAGLIDLLKLPVVLIRDELADAEEQKLNYNITLLKELLPTCKNQKNIENLHKYYTDKTEFKGLTMTLLKDCMVERACQPLPDDDQEKIDKIDFKGGSFKRMLRDKLKEITN